MSRIVYTSIGEEEVSNPKISQNLRVLSNNLRSGVWEEPATLTDLGTNVVFIYGQYQLLGQVCFVSLSFSSDTLDWDATTGPKIDLPLNTTKPYSGGVQGGYIHAGAITLANSSGIYPLTGMYTSTTPGALSRIQLIVDASVSPIDINSAMTHSISGYFWLNI